MVAKATVTAQTDVRARRRRWWALVLLCAAFSMVILDSTIVYVALPSIQRALGFSAAGVQWVVTVYLLTFAGLLLLGGRTADLVGRRTVFIAGLAGFTVASLGCALAPSAEVLIAARVVQAAAAAMLTPAALALLITTFTEEAERNRALGIWGAIGGVGATAGLLVGGPITDGPGWEWSFLINLPVGLLLLAASPVLLRDSRDQTRPRAYDPAGAARSSAWNRSRSGPAGCATSAAAEGSRCLSRPARRRAPIPRWRGRSTTSSPWLPSCGAAGWCSSRSTSPAFGPWTASPRWMATTPRLASGSSPPGSATAKATCSALAKHSANGSARHGTRRAGAGNGPDVVDQPGRWFGAQQAGPLLGQLGAAEPWPSTSRRCQPPGRPPIIGAATSV
jgi:MFS family permease